MLLPPRSLTGFSIGRWGNFQVRFLHWEAGFSVPRHRHAGPAEDALAGHRGGKAGEILAGMAMHGGDRKSSGLKVNLNDMGITGKQSSRWQRAANVSCDSMEISNALPI
jgi:hypothetical protein